MGSAKQTVHLDGNSLTLEQLKRVADGARVTVAQKAKRGVDRARKVVEKAAAGDKAVYGVNTGFGYLAKEQVAKKDLIELQHNFIRSHAAGSGAPLSIPEVRIALTLRLNLFLKGRSGVRWKLCQAIHNLIRKEVYPVVPECGSVGASGDLIPLAHLFLPLIGEGEVFYSGRRTTTKSAFSRAKLKPIQLAEKEGLSSVNGTEMMLSVGGYALSSALELCRWATRIAALSFEGMHGITSAYHPSLHEARRQAGQIQIAKDLRKELQGSSLNRGKRDHCRVQDAYSLRCVPQIHGPSLDGLHYVEQIIARELNAVTDNPFVKAEEKLIISGGNFHGQALAMAFDFAAIACAELGNVSERRLELLCNPHSSGLPAFLAHKEGLHSGYMNLQYLSASLVNENKLLANPSSTDSIPGNVGIEDHVSMGMTSARKLRKVVSNLRTILACEYLAAAQAVDLRDSGTLGKGTQKTYSLLRDQVAPLEEDRILAPEIASAVEILS